MLLKQHEQKNYCGRFCYCSPVANRKRKSTAHKETNKGSCRRVGYIGLTACIQNPIYTSIQDIQAILDGQNAKNTQRATKTSIKTFLYYLSEKQLPAIIDLDMEDLPRILENFYANLQRVDGSEYKLQSIKCIRAGINRWTKSNRSVDIINDTKFTKANEIFKEISKIARHNDTMNDPNPKKLQQCVLFYTIYFFCRHGHENLYDMTINTFEIGIDPDGTEYVFQAIDEMDKNHRADSTDQANQARIYPKPGTFTFENIKIVHKHHFSS